METTQEVEELRQSLVKWDHEARVAAAAPATWATGFDKILRRVSKLNKLSKAMPQDPLRPSLKVVLAAFSLSRSQEQNRAAFLQTERVDRTFQAQNLHATIPSGPSVPILSTGPPPPSASSVTAAAAGIRVPLPEPSIRSSAVLIGVPATIEAGASSATTSSSRASTAAGVKLTNRVGTNPAFPGSGGETRSATISYLPHAPVGQSSIDPAPHAVVDPPLQHHVSKGQPSPRQHTAAPAGGTKPHASNSGGEWVNAEAQQPPKPAAPSKAPVKIKPKPQQDPAVAPEPSSRPRRTRPLKKGKEKAGTAPATATQMVRKPPVVKKDKGRSQEVIELSGDESDHPKKFTALEEESEGSGSEYEPDVEMKGVDGKRESRRDTASVKARAEKLKAKSATPTVDKKPVLLSETDGENTDPYFNSFRP